MKQGKLPIGLRDYEGNELKVKDYIGSELVKLFEFYSYEKIATPTFEYLDVFAKGFSDVKNIYTINDSFGELMALRADATKSIARVIRQKNSIELPIRYCYQTNKFLRKNNLSGEMNEITQCGIELIGKKGLKADVEVIKLAILALKKIGFKDFSFHLCSNEFINLLFEDFSIAVDVRLKIMAAVKSRDLMLLEKILNNLDISSDIKEMIKSLLIMVGKIDEIKTIKSSLKDYKCVEALSYLEDLYNSLGELNAYVSFDFSIATFDTYYTKISFYACLSDNGREILLGGRYDNMIENPEIGLIPSIGFAIELDYILENAMSLIEFPKKNYYYYYVENYNQDLDDELKELYKKGNAVVTMSECDNKEDAYNEFLKMKNYSKFITYSKDGKRSEEAL